MFAEYPRVAKAATLQPADNKLDKEPCGLEKLVQARLVVRIVVKTVRRFTNKCTQHTGRFVLNARSQTIVQAHWNTQKCQWNLCLLLLYICQEIEPAKRACSSWLLVPVKGTSIMPTSKGPYIGINTASSCDRPACFVPELVAGRASICLT